MKVEWEYGPGTIWAEPVSYTHLDVYKRQEPSSTPATPPIKVGSPLNATRSSDLPLPTPPLRSGTIMPMPYGRLCLSLIHI